MSRWKWGYLAVVLALAAPAALMGASRQELSAKSNTQTFNQTSYMKANELLTQVKEHAWAIETSIGSLDQRARYADADWKIEDNTLNDVKEQVNAMGRDIRSIEEIRAHCMSWQQQELDRILPIAKQLADDTSNAIRVFNANVTHEWSTALPKDLAMMRKKAVEVRKSVEKSMEVAKLKKEIAGLEQGA